MSFNTDGALGGAASGASIGASFGPWGAAIGGAVGGLAGGFLTSEDEGLTETESQRRLGVISRARWDRYRSNYLPLEDMLANFAKDEGGREDWQNQARSVAESQFSDSKASWMRQNEGLGLMPNEEQEQSFDRHLGFEQGKARVGAANVAGANYDAIRRAIMGG